MQMDMREEQLLAVERNPMRHTDVADIPTRTRGIDRLHHGFLRAHALQYRIGTDSLSQFLDARYAFIASFSDNVSSAEFTCESLARRVAAHRDDSFGPHLFCGEHAEQSPPHHRQLQRSNPVSQLPHRRRTTPFP